MFPGILERKFSENNFERKLSRVDWKRNFIYHRRTRKISRRINFEFKTFQIENDFWTLNCMSLSTMGLGTKLGMNSLKHQDASISTSWFLLFLLFEILKLIQSLYFNQTFSKNVFCSCRSQALNYTPQWFLQYSIL